MYFCAGDIMILPSRLLHINTGLMPPHQEYTFIIEGNKIYIWQQYDSMIAVELRRVHVMGCAYLYGACSTTQVLHAVLLRVGIV